MADKKTSKSKSILTKGFGFIILAIIIMAIVWYQMMADNQQKIQKMLDEQTESRAIFTMRDAAYQRALILHRMALLDDEFDRDEEYLRFKEKAEDFMKAREIFLESMKNGSFPKELSIWQQALPDIRKGARIQSDAAEHLLNDENKIANELLLDEVVPTQNRVMKNLTKLLEEQREITKKTVEQVLKQNQSGLIIMTLLAAWAILWSISIGFYTIRRTSRIEDSLQVARQKAQDADNSKSQFLANMSHEIRTPLTAIIGYSETLIEDKQNLADWKEYVGSIIRNGKHLHQLINDILDLSKIEANQLSIEIIPVSPCELAAEIELLMGERARKKGLGFKLDYHLPIPKIIYSDPTRLKQILINLCGNAIKFTADGSITLAINYDESHNKISFTVADTGIGMTKEQSAELFKPFQQADQSTTRKFGGTGLGLYISKQLAERLGGDLSSESQPGVGSRFSATIDAGEDSNREFINSLEEAKALTQISQPASAIPSLAGTVLLAEDNSDNQALISMHIEKTGAKVTVVENGEQAVKRATTENFDLILMDMQMPIMGGIEAITRLRDSGCQTPIATLTANAMKEDIEQSKRAGANEFLSKPIDRKAFYAVLKKYLSPTHNDNATQCKKPAASDTDDFDDIGDLSAVYANQLPETCYRLERYIAAKEWHEVKSEVHQLKGTGGAFGFPEITQQCIDIEKRLTEENYDKASPLITQLIATCMNIANAHGTNESKA